MLKFFKFKTSYFDFSLLVIRNNVMCESCVTLTLIGLTAPYYICLRRTITKLISILIDQNIFYHIILFGIINIKFEL